MIDLALTISILGCGWLGLPLGVALLQEGYVMNGSTTSKEKLPLLKAKGINPCLLKFDEDESLFVESGDTKNFFTCDILIINIPPQTKSKHDDFHPAQLRQIITKTKQFNVQKVIYISATSVYPKSKKVVDEDTAISIHTTGNKALFKAEQLLLKEDSFKTNLLRCGGLLGYDRIPGKYYIGKRISNGETPVNYIHRDDAVAIIQMLIKKAFWNNVYNLVAPLHPTRKAVFEKNAQDFNFAPPHFAPALASNNYKLVSGDKLIRALPYDFLFPDPLHFYYIPLQ